MRKPSEIRSELEQTNDPQRQEELRLEKSKLVTDYGRKIADIRQRMIAAGKGQEFVEWRKRLYSLPEDARLAMIDEEHVNAE